MIRAILLTLIALPAVAADAPYLDDRSDGPALIRSYYNAINAQEYARAYAYFGARPPVPTYDAFAQGYADTTRVTLRTGPDEQDADMGGVTHHVGVVLQASQVNAPAKVFSGCYTLRQSAWWKTDPPVFSPLTISGATLAPSATSFAEAQIPTNCLQ